MRETRSNRDLVCKSNIHRMRPDLSQVMEYHRNASVQALGHFIPLKRCPCVSISILICLSVSSTAAASTDWCRHRWPSSKCPKTSRGPACAGVPSHSMACRSVWFSIAITEGRIACGIPRIKLSRWSALSDPLGLNVCAYREERCQVKSSECCEAIKVTADTDCPRRP